MRGMKFWRDENTDEIIVEIFNACDLLTIQKELVNDGYCIIKILCKDENHIYMKVKDKSE